MSNIISESKKISDLPAILGFSEKAVVLIVDGGKTAQMSLKLLTQTIAEATVEKDNALAKSVKDNTDAIGKVATSLETLSGKQNDFQKEVSSNESKQNGRISANENNINSIMYHANEITVADVTATNRQYRTSGLTINSKFDPEKMLVAAKTGTYALSREIKAGDVIHIGDYYDMVETSDAPNIILVDADGKVISMVRMSAAKAQGHFNFGNMEGTMYLSAMMAESSDTVLFEHKTLIDFSELVNEINALKDPLVLYAEKATQYTEDATIGDKALNAILTGRQIVIRVPNADGGKYTAIYSPVYMYQLPNYQNKYLYLFYLNDGLDASGLPSYSQLKMLLSKEYNYSPLEQK